MDGASFESVKSPEKIILTYQYTFSDNKVLGHPVVFTCEFELSPDVDPKEADIIANSIADKAFSDYVKEQRIDLTDSEIIRSSVKNIKE